MYETVCTYPFTSEVFAQAIHPREPVVAVGTASGHVQALRLPSLQPDLDNGSASPATSTSSHSVASSGRGTVETLWQTRRHKLSCRTLAFSPDGDHLVSAGADGMLKLAAAETGRVLDKIQLPLNKSQQPDLATSINILNRDTLILGTEAGIIHLHDLRNPSVTKSIPDQHPSLGQCINPKPTRSFFAVHDDYVSSITPLQLAADKSTSSTARSWVTTGATTLAALDLRKGLIAQSADQEEELLCSASIIGLSARGTNTGSKVAVGTADGVLLLFERGVWDDQDERVIVDSARAGGESLDAIATLPDHVAGSGALAVGLGDGKIRLVKVGGRGVLDEVRHDELEGVVAIGFEPEGRMVSAGGLTVKVWQEMMGQAGAYDSDAASNDDEDDDSEDGLAVNGHAQPSSKKRPSARAAKGNESSDDDEDSKQSRRRKRKRKGGKDRSAGVSFEKIAGFS